MITKIQSKFENPSFKTIKGNRTLPNHYVFKYTHDDVFNKIEIIESIKTCGFSTTYIGEISYSINNKKKKVVIKEFFPVLNHLCQRTDFSDVNPIANFEYFRKRFRIESDALDVVTHDNIVKKTKGINRFDENGTTYYIMDYINGNSLNDYIYNKGPFNSFEDVWKYLRPLCEGLKKVHNENLIHCDIQPANIMVDSDDNIIKLILIDFGSCVSFEDGKEGANFTINEHQTHHSLYSPLELVNRSEYITKYKDFGSMAENITAATDIYSLGAVIYFMLIGEKYEILSENEIKCYGKNAAKCRDIVDNGFKFPNDFDPIARKIIEKSMQPIIENRPQSMDDFIAFCDKQLEQPRFNPFTKVRVNPSITLEELKNQGAVTITIPLNKETLSSEIIEGYKWKTLLDDNPTADYYVGDMKFKRITLKASVDNNKEYVLKTLT